MCSARLCSPAGGPQACCVLLVSRLLHVKSARGAPSSNALPLCLVSNTYIVQTEGNCATPITMQAECEAAAYRLAKWDTTASAASASNVSTAIATEAPT